MANLFPIIILTVSTILLLIGMCTSLPHRRDTAIGAENCDKSVPHIVIVNSTTGEKLKCHKCECDYPGHGLNILCNGQNITQSQIHIECVPCVSGVNYSTGETYQCQPCLPKKCDAGYQLVGKCEVTGDKRDCKRCEQPHWYYNDTQMTCLPCDCQNMTVQIKQICNSLGFNSDTCKTEEPKTVPTTPADVDSFQDEEGKVWEDKYTIIIVGFVVVAVLVLYLCCVRSRTKQLKREHPQLSICNRAWICPIFCFKKATSGRPPSYTTDDGHSQNGNGTERSLFLERQYSCPVTQNEKYAGINTPHAVTFSRGDGKGHETVKLLDQECGQQKLKFLGMNSETCRQILQALKQNVEMGMGYKTLAGFMGFSAKQVKDFEVTKNPCESMLTCWGNLDTKENNVLKLQGLVEKLKRDDILELLKSELDVAKEKCGCRVCTPSVQRCQGQLK